MAPAIRALAINPGETGGIPNELLGINIMWFALIVVAVLGLIYVLKFWKRP